MTDQLRPFYDAARALYPLLPAWYELVSDGATPEFRGLNAGGLPVLEVPPHYTLTADEGAHEAGHAYLALLVQTQSAVNYGQAYWDFRGFPGTWAAGIAGAMAVANRPASTDVERLANANEAFQVDPRESWAEAFARSVVTTHREKTLTYGKDANPLALREFFQSFLKVAPPSPVAEKAVEGTPVTERTTVVDYYAPHDAAFMECLANSGIGGIARYLVVDPGSDVRAVTAQEVADAQAAGLAVHFVFEMDPTWPGYFTFERGQRDARAAHWQLLQLKAPQGTVVYFAVDAPAPRIPPSVLTPYFNGVEDVCRNEDNGLLVPGMYGFEEHIEYARANYPNVGKHLWQTYGTPRGLLDLWQHEQKALCGVAVDLNTCDAPGWRSDVAYVTKEELEAYKEALQKQLEETVYARLDSLAATAHARDHEHKPGEVI